MSREERMAILQMVQEGKITAEDGVNLIKAVETAEQRELEAANPSLAAPAAEGGDQPTPVVTDGKGLIREGGVLNDDVISRLASELLGLFGPGRRVEEDIEGEFAADGPVTIEFSTTNGRIDIKPWDGPGFKLHLIKTVRAGSDKQAEEAARDLAVIDNVPGLLSVRMREGFHFNTGLAIEALLPRDRVSDLRLRTSNGRVEVVDIDCATCNISTSNGRIVAEGVSARSANLKTSNGSITASGMTGSVDAGSSNGSITLTLAGTEGDIKMHTSNGSIRCYVPQDNAAGFDIEARTMLGSITADVPNLEIINQEKSFGHNYLRARTADLASRQRQVRVTATTSNGSIGIVPGRQG
ncbi:MAG: DUF4097 family beta strand repeat-containing protein [Chloroflexota bacterium]